MSTTLHEPRGMEGKVALVTGAGRMRSIGRAVALELAGAGCDVFVTGTGRDPDRRPPEEREAGWRDVDSVVEEVRALGRRAGSAAVDVSDADDVDRLLHDVLEQLGHVDILVNNASAPRGPDQVPVLDLEPEVWNRVLAINLTGTMNVSRAVAAHMVARERGGSIVNIASVSAKTADARFAAYSASKAGVLALTSVMAKELAASSIRVNAVCPGLIETNRVADLWESGRADTYVEANVPLGRAGRPADVAATVAFLCSDAASWVTGQQWNVDGGQVTMR